MEFLITLISLYVIHLIFVRIIKEAGKREWLKQREEALTRQQDRQNNTESVDEKDNIAEFVREWQR